MWCCDGFKYLYEQRNDRALFIFAEIDNTIGNKMVFWFGMRSVNKCDIDRLKSFGLPCDMPISINTRVPIKHCPWCGVVLDKHYANTGRKLLDQDISAEFV